MSVGRCGAQSCGCWCCSVSRIRAAASAPDAVSRKASGSNSPPKVGIAWSPASDSSRRAANARW